MCSVAEEPGLYDGGVQYAKPAVAGSFGRSYAINTPVSLIPAAREFSPSYGGTAKLFQAPMGETAADLYRYALDDGLLVGHIAGAFAMLWFNPWQDIMGVLRGELPRSALDLGGNLLCFMRYLKFVLTSAKINQHSVLVALLYLCRFRQSGRRQPQRGAPTSEARISITSLMIADKHEDDVSYTSATWAKLGNINIDEVKKMEIEFLLGLDFNLHISGPAWAEFSGFTQGSLFPLVDSLLPQLC